MISTRDLTQLPGIDDLRALWQSLAMLDAILSPDSDYRYYAFNRHWGAEPAMGSMRDGEGDHLFALFTSDGCILKGYAHEAQMAPDSLDRAAVWPGIFESVPAIFRDFLAESAVAISRTTFCVWRLYGDTAWRRGDIEFPFDPNDDPDGSADLLGVFDGDPETYQSFAEYYYEQPVSPAAIIAIYRHQPLTSALVAELNPATTLEDLRSDIDEIGYP
jgi:hypothetical protein